jgi:hypothetical protein
MRASQQRRLPRREPFAIRDCILSGVERLDLYRICRPGNQPPFEIAALQRLFDERKPILLGRAGKVGCERHVGHRAWSPSGRLIWYRSSKAV